MNHPQPMPLPSAESLERIREIAERTLTAAELDAYVSAPMTEAEREEILNSVAWYRRRYPTAGERLAAARRAFIQWTRSVPGSKL